VIIVIDTLARRSFDIENVRGSQVSLLRSRANTIKFNKATILTTLDYSNSSGIVASRVPSLETKGDENSKLGRLGKPDIFNQERG
jgi:hypothetical protein